MKYQDQELEKLKTVEIDILKEIIRVCEANDLVYFTVGGTTLGAIRHNGFIPWDDDIDIGMLRDDYDRFLLIAPHELREGYTLTHFIYDENVPTYFAKVRKDGTKFVEEYTKDINMHQGVYVDVFPFDYVPENKKIRRRYNRKVFFWNQLFIAKSVKTTTFHPKKNIALLNAIRRTLHFLLKPFPKQILFNKTDSALRKYDNTMTSMVSSRGLEVFCVEIEDILPPITHSFESIDVSVPARTDKVLRKQYGDYMCLPPEEDRLNHAPQELRL